MDTTALWLTLKLACCTTLILLVAGLPLAWWLATTRARWRFLVEALVAMPLVLPPTVLGFYLLMATGPRSAPGAQYLEWTGSTLPFSFPGILLASVLFNLPFAVRPFMAGFSAVPRDLMEAGACLGAPPRRAFLRVAVPIAAPGIVSGALLTFAHTIGEFGVVLMVGGNIPGVTRTLSISLYDDVQALNYERAGHTALLLLAFSFLTLCLLSLLQPRRRAESR
jgi:molybdate transport system permease protein